MMCIFIFSYFLFNLEQFARLSNLILGRKKTFPLDMRGRANVSLDQEASDKAVAFSSYGQVHRWKAHNK